MIPSSLYCSACGAANAASKLYLIDFGIARRFKPGKLKDTIPFGSPGYAAPEQYGKTQTTPRADIYSLGALLHRLLSGDDPARLIWLMTRDGRNQLWPLTVAPLFGSFLLSRPVSRHASFYVVSYEK